MADDGKEIDLVQMKDSNKSTNKEQEQENIDQDYLNVKYRLLQEAQVAYQLLWKTIVTTLKDDNHFQRELDNKKIKKKYLSVAKTYQKISKDKVKKENEDKIQRL